jgi:hypothetical protein
MVRRQPLVTEINAGASPQGGPMPFVNYLAVLPFLGILVGVPLLNRVEPLVMGMPLILAWIVLWVVLTAVIMAIIYCCDPANRDAEGPGT